MAVGSESVESFDNPIEQLRDRYARPDDVYKYAIAIFLFVLAVWASTTVIQTVQRIVHFYCAIPLYDYWRVPENFHDYQRFHIQALWRQHNEHRIIFPEIVFAVDALLLHERQVLPLALSFLCYVLTFAAVAMNFCSDKALSWTAQAMTVLTAAVIALWQGCASSLAAPFLLQWTLMELAVACGLAFVVSLKQTGTSKYLFFTITAGVIATYSSANGLVFWPLLLGAGLLLEIERRHVLILLLAATAFVGLYFVGYHVASNAQIENPSRHLGYLIEFVAAYIGMPFSEVREYPQASAPRLGICVGLCSLLSVIALAVVAWRRGLLTSRTGIMLFGMFAFAVLTAFLTAIGRMSPQDQSVQAALASRYITIPLMNWAVMLLIYFWFAAHTKWGIKAVLCSCATAALLLSLSFVRLKPWLAAESEFYASHQLGELSLQDDLFDQGLIRNVFPWPDFVEKYLPELKTHRLSIYYKWQGKWLGKYVANYSTPPHTSVPGAITFTFPVSGGVEIAGWADESKLRRTYKWVVFNNEQGQIVGFGERLPAGFPSNLATWQTPPSLGWVGFVNLRYPAKAIWANLVDTRGGGLYGIPDGIALPKIQLAQASEIGSEIVGVSWSGETTWRNGRLPIALPEHGPQGPIYSSWNGKDQDTGEWESSPFAVPSNNCVIIPVLHGPRVFGLSVSVSNAESNQVIANMPMQDDEAIWNFWRVPIPESTHQLRIAASDTGTGWGEWVAVANPAECR